jgi:hypothetical protein
MKLKTKSRIFRLLLIMCLFFSLVLVTSDRIYAGGCLYLNEGKPHNFNYHVFLSGKQYSQWETYNVDYDIHGKPMKIYQARSVVEVYVYECVCGESRVDRVAVAPEMRTIP